VTDPRPFELDHPEAAMVLAGMCQDNAAARSRGKRNRAMVLNPPEPIKSTKVGRNNPCPCGSGRKYKKCCGR